MIIKQLSDLHLEFPLSRLELTRNGADLLVLGGDIATAKNLIELLEFIGRCAATYPHIVYVMGNHEYYGSRMGGDVDALAVIETALSMYDNVHVLDGDHIVVEDTPIWGGTLWTDCNNGDVITRAVLRNGMNDYRAIKTKGGKSRLDPVDTELTHREQLVKLRAFLAMFKDKDCVVVTHHAPSRTSIHADYRADYHMNGGYASQLDTLIMDNPQIKLWTHGHTHHSFDYVIGSTRVLCNPAGYPIRGRDGKVYRENADFDPKLVVEI